MALTVAAPTGETTAATARRSTALLARAPVVVVVMAAVWASLSFALGAGYLTPDTGAKVATHEAMARRGDLVPDLGYWLTDLDPDGSLHPYMNVRRVGEASVAVTTLPMLFLAHPLYLAGGHHAALAVPALGGVVAAFAAGGLARRLGSSREVAAVATWVTGLAGPVAVYALSLWEHTVGLALMAWGAAWTIDAMRRHAPWRSAMLAGLAFGAAAAMRQEAFVYAVVAGALVAGPPVAAGRLRSAAAAGASFAAGAVGASMANVALEVAVLGSSLRNSRSASALASAGVDVGVRAEAALATLAAPVSSGDRLGLALGLALAVALVMLVRGALDGRSVRIPAAALAAVATVGALFQLQVGPAFVPGLIAASPLAGAGLALASRRATWQRGPVAVALALALAPLPLVWTVQYARHGAWPQWGGRYILLTGLLLSVVAVVELAGSNRRLLGGLVVANVLLTSVGLATVVSRSHAYERLVDQIEARPEPVLVFYDGFLVQEAGTAGLDRPWLRATTADQRREAAEVLSALGVDHFAFLGPEALAPTFGGYQVTGVGVLGDDGGRQVTVTTFEAAAGTAGRGR